MGIQETNGNRSDIPFFPDMQANQGVSGIITLNESSQDENGAFASQVSAQVHGRNDRTDGLKNNLSFGPVDLTYNQIPFVPQTAVKTPKAAINQDAFKSGHDIISESNHS